MKPYDQLTHLGRVRRYHRLASAALAEYGISNAHLKFIRDSGNVTFRVVPTDEDNFAENDPHYFRNHLVLRMHEPGYQSAAAIQSELEWLAALCRETDLTVPEPQRTTDGALFVEVQIPGIPQARQCSLLRWMTGRLLQENLQPAHYRALGVTMAKLHTHAESWQFPAGFTRPHYDWDGLFGDNDFVKVPASEAWKQIPDQYIKPFETVVYQVQDVMTDFSQDADAFGLIHADISIGDNVLFGGQPMEARPIDFDDCAFGYWMFDIGVALSELRKTSAFPWCKDALLEGYSQVRSMPAEQWMHLDLFIAAWHAFEVFWAASGTIKFPQYRQAYDRWIERAAEDMMRCIEHSNDQIS
jgi:Ser/Thr protein kinase RdoA (MazF antagonist)